MGTPSTSTPLYDLYHHHTIENRKPMFYLVEPAGFASAVTTEEARSAGFLCVI